MVVLSNPCKEMFVLYASIPVTPVSQCCSVEAIQRLAIATLCSGITTDCRQHLEPIKVVVTPVR